MSKKRPPIVPPGPSRVILALLGASFVLQFAVILFLSARQAQLGQGYFQTRWSPPQIRALKTERIVPFVLLGGAGAGSILLLARRERSRQRTGAALLATTIIATGAWTWLAPPSVFVQQMFNMTSPSADGAFALEAMEVRSLSTYLKDFPQRLKLSPEQMGGTRVLSNPPLTTVIAHFVPRSPEGAAPSGRLERHLVERYQLEPRDAPTVAYALRVSMLLGFLWTLSGFAAYLLARLFLSPAGAAAFAAIVVFNPCTIHFVPGKDPAQLLTICLMLWGWFAAWKRRKPWLAALVGAILTIGATMGLVHIWVAGIAVIATIWEDRRAWKPLAVNALAAAGGAIVVCALAYLTLDWSIPTTLFAVSRRWSELQRTFSMNRFTWFLIGLPIFLLFLSPAFWTLAGMSLRRRRLNLGVRLALTTVAVMAIIYVVTGVTYELPRLWIAFLPTLLLGLAIDRPLFRGERGHPRAARTLALIVFVQVAFTALHWTLFDPRETEYRLTSQRYYN